MRRSLILAGAVLLCSSSKISALNSGENSPSRFNPQETAQLQTEGVNLTLAGASAQAELRRALDSRDPAAILAAKNKLRRSGSVYGRWFNNPSAAMAMKSSSNPADRERFRQEWGLLHETLPPATMTSLYQLKLKRLGFQSPEPEDPFKSSLTSGPELISIPTSETLSRSEGFSSPSDGKSLSEAIVSEFCRIFACSN